MISAYLLPTNEKENSPVAMGASIRKFREARYLTLAEVAEKIGVTEIELKRMERRWDDPSPHIARDLAVLLNCNVHDLIGTPPKVEDFRNWPYAVVDVENDEFGGVYIDIAGKKLAYPISKREADRLFNQLQAMEVSNDGAEQAWLNTSTLCGRSLFMNPSAIRSIFLKHDDEAATPDYAHPEVYRALYNYDDKEERGPVLQAAVEALAGIEDVREDNVEDQRRVKFLFLDGSEDNRYLHDDWVASALFSLEGQSFAVQSNSLLHVEHEGGYVNGWVNLSHVAMLDVPLEQYLRLTAPD